MAKKAVVLIASQFLQSDACTDSIWCLCQQVTRTAESMVNSLVKCLAYY